MKKHWKKVTSVVFAVLLVASVISALFISSNTQAIQAGNEIAVTETVAKKATEPPKYIFLFIGDGMSYPQIQTASYYLGAKASDGGVVSIPLSFMDFPVSGAAETYDSTSFAPDSASTATSIATGYKTYSGVINMDTTFTKKFEAISEKLKNQLGYKIGIITSVNLNHATPLLSMPISRPEAIITR